MCAKLNVLPQADFDEWLQNDPYKGMSIADIGQKVFTSKCLACHNVSAEKKVGPGFGGLFGTERKFADGSVEVADENYIRTSILNPNGQIVEGYPAGVMPMFQGQISEQELTRVIEYLKGLN
mgnify:CR=1 FL=1